MTTTTHIQKWGNSLAVRLPKELVDKVFFEEGKAVFIESRDGSLVIRPSIKPETLHSMVNQITKQNQQRELDWKDPVGLELW